MKQHISFRQSPCLAAIYELGLKNQRLITRSLDCKEWLIAHKLRKIDHHLTRLLRFAKQAGFPSRSEQLAAGITQYIWRTQGDGIAD